MTSQMGNRLEEAAVHLREQGERVRAFQAETEQRSTTVVSKDRMVSATVNGAGRLTALAIRGSRYRSMSSAELASTVMETVNSAWESAAAQTMAAARALLPADLESAGVTVDGTIDLTDFVDRAMNRVGDSTVWRQDRPTRGGES
ncbi:YbaB/EbfC family nucleoid-associated protein [Micromonospora craniellae]|uniref:YbaB/EbfC family DNA-binding protein n=1 Tax=Micromonospora craniellae TaxID=2294034 RepID=A0A372FY58_9ACTN|nr:YbaB/EbfC family nucleoid-associated protein [Micromonospora craniellae]RFS45554.1 YbaB/EbfC family DNA-binding protein [Micromonospora craniellae]